MSGDVTWARSSGCGQGQLNCPIYNPVYPSPTPSSRFGRNIFERDICVSKTCFGASNAYKGIMTSLPKHHDASFSNQSGVLSANTGGGPQNNNHFGIQYNFGKDNKEILQSLAFPHMLDRRDSIERPHAHTCQWIFELENYKSWRNQSSGLLWIKGKAGAGKSTLMLCLHEELKKLHESPRGIQIEFFFTARGAEMQHIPLGMFRSLLNQIFDADENVQTPVRDAYTERCRKFGDTKGQWEWSQQTLADLLANAILTSAKDQDVTIFVDALDETGSESAEMMANYFHELNNRAERAGRRVKICISCRHYPIVGNPTATEITVEQHNSADITRYIEDTLLGENSQQVADRDQWKGLVDELIKQASGMFQWAKIVAPIISRQIKEKKSREKIRAWLKRVPPDLEGVYQYILSEVIPDDDQGEAFLFFQWLHLAQRPLTVTEMRYAMAMANTKVVASLRRAQEIEGLVENNEAMKTRVKVLSGGLAEVTQSDTNDEIIQVIHQSVNDFLHDKGLASLASKVERTTLPATQVLIKCQARLYHSCLKYLAIVEVTVQKLEHVPIKKQEEYVKSQPFLSYATLNLLVHGEKAANFRTHELRDEVQLLEQIVCKWTRVYRVLDDYGSSRPPTGTTVMHMAATANLLNVIENLASNKQNVSRIDDDGKTPLHLAARQGHITGAKLLREKGAGTEAIGKDGRTPIVEAASHGHKELIEWLLKSDAKVDGSGKGAGTALQEASLNGQLVVVDLLLEKGADVNAQGGQYGNALQAASYHRSAEVVQMLLDAKAYVNTQGGQYGNALQAASHHGLSKVVWMLLDAKADVNAQGGSYGNALQAASLDGSAEVVQMLLDAKADVNAQGGQYGNALQAASLDGSAEVVQILLDAKANVNAHGGEYGYPLLAAVYQGFVHTVDSLLQTGANPELSDHLYRTPLHIAASKNMLHILRKHPCLASTLNAQDRFSRTPLQLAVIHGHTRFALALLELGADPYLLDGYGRNSLDWAADNLQLATQLRNTFPAIAPTDNELQSSMVRRSIHQISATLLTSDYHHSWALLQQLGHYLMFLKDEDNARLIFNLDLSQEYLLGVKFRLTCDICDEPIYGTRVICRVCANLDLCLPCRHKHPTHGRLNAPQAHDVLEVPYEQPPDSQQARQRLNDLLRRFSLQFGGPSMPGSITTTVTDPSPEHPVFLQYSGPQALSYPVFVGILVTSFCTWYFHYRK
ncbi:uncharacterized protein N7500_008993 [Penicillium coprophilum]|uniref:uncharacterized protein n=1 Tax=Penicillium coprophilum TaxID=36646 RepID=UPI00239DE49F|nr:uncharacterized protein N7500_008993 [Penicillium coprophilum]KAJ5159342.1 hypothetical protein N7500_008993 [Penicillium coprophilum]